MNPEKEMRTEWLDAFLGLMEKMNKARKKRRGRKNTVTPAIADRSEASFFLHF